MKRGDGLGGAALLAVAIGAASIGCGGLAKTVPFEAPPRPQDATTMVVYTRGGFTDYLVVLDGEKVVGASTRNSWFHVEVPPGKHELMFMEALDPDEMRKRNLMVGRSLCDGKKDCEAQLEERVRNLKFPCQRVVAETVAAHTYFIRMRFISPASPTVDKAVDSAAAMQSQVDASKQFAELSGNRALGPTAAQQQQAAQKGGEASLMSGMVGLSNDPDATPPFLPEDLGWTVRGISDVKALGPGGTGRLKEWDRVVIASPEKAQDAFDRIRKAMPLACADGPPAAKVEPKDHLE
ncbi:MAG: hypothetical protein U0359_38870 [Byssovorax sp.]